jgi:hypothetical protein
MNWFLSSCSSQKLLDGGRKYSMISQKEIHNGVLCANIISSKSHKNRKKKERDDTKKKGKLGKAWACSQLKVAKMRLLALPSLSVGLSACNNSRRMNGFS